MASGAVVAVRGRSPTRPSRAAKRDRAQTKDAGTLNDTAGDAERLMSGRANNSLSSEVPA